MKINKVLAYSKRPSLYEKGTAQMWTDKYISQQLLQVHLNEKIDLASRKKTTIAQTVDWILEQTNQKRLNILDLGCGPGLYAEILATKGHSVTGVDFSEHSINYAKESAAKKSLQIEYVHKDYLDLGFDENSFNLIMLIFTDFGVLNPEERDVLLKSVKKLLKPRGVFIFDVLNDLDIDKKISPKTWETAEKGFWKNDPYLALSESFFYAKEKVVLNQHLVIDEREKIDVYRFWIHFFSHRDLTDILKKNAFRSIEFFENVLPAGGIWNGKNVTFCKVAI